MKWNDVEISCGSGGVSSTHDVVMMCVSVNSISTDTGVENKLFVSSCLLGCVETNEHFLKL